MSRLLPLLAASDPGFTPSNYMPAFRVEIAFTSGYNTPDADRVWTDVSEWVELGHGITDTFGRQDERSTADANDLTLTLDNSDGRFTAGRAASPYYPNVKVGRPIRLSLMTVTGFTSVRFVGFVNQWPVEWDGTDAYAKATVTAGSRLSRLGLGNKLRSMIEAEIGSYNPAAYWTMGDPADSAAAQDSAGRNAARVVGSGAPIVFGNATGPSTDGITAAQFAGSSSWAMGINPVVFDGEYLKAESFESDDVTGIRATALVSGLPGSGAHAYVIDGGSQAFDFSGVANLDSPAIAIDELGRACIRGLTGPSINDGATHDLLCVVTPGVQAELFVDGVSAGVGSVIGPTAPTEYRIGQGFNGVISHAAVYAGATLTSTQAAVQADVVLTGAAGDTTDERLTRILGWAGVPSAEISTQTGSETMTYQQTSGQTVVDALRDVESTEGGVLFDGADGRVTFHNRSHRYTAPVAVTFDMAEQQVEADYAPKLDRSTLTNDVTVDNPTTGESARSVDTASGDEYGVVTGSAKSIADSYDPLQQKAAWLVASYAEPRPRVPSLTVDVLAQVGGTPSAEDILALTIGSRIKVTNQPTQADATDADYFVEGYSEAIGPESYRITFNLSPAHPSLSVFIVDDAVRGLLDEGNLLGL